MVEFLGTLTKQLLKMDWKRKTKPKSCCRQCDYRRGLQRRWPMTQTPPRTLDTAATAAKTDRPLPLLHSVTCSQCRVQGRSDWLSRDHLPLLCLPRSQESKPFSLLWEVGVRRVGDPQTLDPDPGRQHSSESTPGSKKLEGPGSFWYEVWREREREW